MSLRCLLLCAIALVFAATAVGQQSLPAAMDALGNLDFRQVVANATAKVFPAVVFIKVVKETHESGKRQTVEVAGSGVLISREGEIVTNWHVVDKAVEVRCLLYDGTGSPAEVVGTDKDSDLALIKLQGVEHPDALCCAEFGDSTALKEGDFVMAMGAPWGLNRSVSIGIISCSKRYLPSQSEYSLWLQTDASICPGNSGGPLVDTAGRIVGINTLGAMMGGDMGFAIPSSHVRSVVEDLRKHGQVQRAWTGLQLQALNDFNRNIYFDGDGVIVAETDPDSPARQGGLQPRDRILAINGATVDGRFEENLPAIRSLLAELPNGKPAELSVTRDGKAMTLQLTPREKGKVEGEELDCPRWDMTVKTINQFDNPDLYYYRTEGVFIFGVKQPGNASEAGLATGDILLSIDGHEIKTLADVRQVHEAALANIQCEHRVLVTVLRQGLMTQIILDFARDYERR